MTQIIVIYAVPALASVPTMKSSTNVTTVLPVEVVLSALVDYFSYS